MVSEFEFVRFHSAGQGEYLMSQTYSKDRDLSK